MLLRDHWTDVLRVVVAATVAAVSTIFGVFALSFAVDTAGLDRSAMLWVAILANVVALAAIPLWATLADRVGRKPVFITGALGSAVLTAVYLWSITTGSYLLVFLAGVLLSGIDYSAANGVWPAFYGEMFPARAGCRARPSALRSASRSAASHPPWPRASPGAAPRAGFRSQSSPRSSVFSPHSQLRRRGRPTRPRCVNSARSEPQQPHQACGHPDPVLD